MNILNSFIGIYKRVRHEQDKTYYSIGIGGRHEIIKVLSAIEPYLVGKKYQAKVLLKLLKDHKEGSKFNDNEKLTIGILKDLKNENRVAF